MSAGELADRCGKAVLTFNCSIQQSLPIGDDLLTSFDGLRTLAMLRLMASVGSHRQIILFTHHQHVVDMARSLPNDLIDIATL